METEFDNSTEIRERDRDVALPRYEHRVLLRGRLSELSDDRETWLVCGVGQRAYYATRALMQNDIEVKNLSGGMQTYQTFQKAGLLP